MSNTLTDSELEQLAELGKSIRGGLECDLNDTGVPCRTDRLWVVEDMKKYLEIHDYYIVDM